MHKKKFQNTEPPLPKVWVSGFPSVDGNGISVLAIMKTLKNGHHFVNVNHMEKLQITDPSPKFWSLVYPMCHPCVVLHFLIFSTFKYDDVPMIKTFMHGYSPMMTFLHLKVHNGSGKFSIGSVFQIFHLFSFPHHIMFSFDI